jgi:oligopeptide transport system permease protein
MFKHIFPNAIGTIITGSILSIPGVIFSESSLSYLRIIDLETSGFTSVGTLLSNGSGFVNTYPHILVPPVVFISLLMISFNLFGNGLRDALNPSLRGADE